jgi:hypothetical protein
MFQTTVSVLREERAVLQEERPRAPGLEDLARIAEVGLALFGDASERVEGRPLRSHHGCDPPVDRQATEVAAPRDTHAAEVARERLTEPRAGFGGRQRSARVRPADHAEEQRHVFDGARQGSLHAESEPQALARPHGDATE